MKTQRALSSTLTPIYIDQLSPLKTMLMFNIFMSFVLMCLLIFQIANGSEPNKNEPDSNKQLLEEINSIRRDGMSVQSRKNLRKQAVKQEEAEIMALVSHCLRTEAPFAERLVRFWSNHFT